MKATRLRKHQIWDTRQQHGATYVLLEHTSTWLEAKAACAEYIGMGFCAQYQTDVRQSCYNIWVGPERRRRARFLPDEKPRFTRSAPTRRRRRV